MALISRKQWRLKRGWLFTRPFYLQYDIRTLGFPVSKTFDLFPNSNILRIANFQIFKVLFGSPGKNDFFNHDDFYSRIPLRIDDVC